MKRQELEKRIMRKIAGNIFRDNCAIKVTCNDREQVGATEFHKSITTEFISDATCSDLITWEVYDANGNPCGGIMFVLGNCGWDVVADHHMQLTRYMPTDEEQDRYESLTITE